MENREDIRGLTAADLKERLTELGEKPFRAAQVYDWLHAKDAAGFEEMTNLSKNLREQLALAFTAALPETADRRASADGSVKYLFRLADGELVEAVYMPEDGRGTLCLSTQAGCRFACAFCATGKGGFRRNLTAGEMLAQLAAVRREFGKEAVTNLVFMGMGEPLDNRENLYRALQTITDPKGYGFGVRRITVSTVGLPEAIPDFGRRWPGVNLAVSLHAADQAVRDRLLPGAKRYPVAELMDACRVYPLQKTRRITMEVIPLKGVNDSGEDAAKMVKALAGVKAKVNLIPFNSVPEAGLEGTDQASLNAYRQTLERSGIPVTLRKSRGEDIEAACGQLRGRSAAASSGRDSRESDKVVD